MIVVLFGYGGRAHTVRSPREMVPMNLGTKAHGKEDGGLEPIL